MVRCQLATLAVALATATGADRSISPSRQFIVYGGDIRLRGAICDLAEAAKANVLSLIGEHDAWRLPIVIRAELPQANFPEAAAAKLQLMRSEAGLKVQVELTIDRSTQALSVERQLLRAILLELEYRTDDSLAAGSSYIEPPPWLVEGILARKSGNESAAEIVRPAIAGGSAMPLASLLEQRPSALDATSLQLYRKYSAALLDLILRADDGAPGRLAEFIRDARRAATDAVADLVAHFPQLNGVNGVAAAWKQQLTRLAAADSYKVLSVAETEHELDALLRVRVGDATYSLVELAKLPRADGWQTALRRCREQLLLFQPRANPVYREIVLEYQRLATSLTRGATRHIVGRLARVTELREQLAARTAGIDDYLNWFEATQQTTSSGLFVNYISRVDAAERRDTRRRDAVSIYLDAIENQL